VTPSFPILPSTSSFRAYLLVALVALVALPAGADETDDKARSTARAHFIRGNSFFDLSRYDEAIAEYEAAYQAKNDPALLYNIAQAHRLAGHPAAALRLYKAYLARRPDAPNRREVEAKIDSLERLVEQQHKSETAPPEAPLPPAHTTSAPEPAAPVLPAAPPVDARAGRTKKIAGLAVAGAGVALVAGGIACAVLAQNASDSLSAADRAHLPYDPKLDSTFHTDQALAGALLGVGGAALVGGTVLYVLGWRESRSLRLSAAVTPGYVSVGASVRF
jgi:tetratricopeptide (TPR) repeat protein